MRFIAITLMVILLGTTVPHRSYAQLNIQIPEPFKQLIPDSFKPTLNIFERFLPSEFPFGSYVEDIRATTRGALNTVNLQNISTTIKDFININDIKQYMRKGIDYLMIIIRNVIEMISHKTR